MKFTPKISIVIPVYRAEKIVAELVKRLEGSLVKITNEYEIVLVEDGSPDNSWEAIDKECNLNKHVKGVKLSRNFGQHAAILTGLYYAKGECAIVMDCDLQDDPKYISDLYNKHLEGNDVVYTVKKERKHSFFKNISARLFNKIFNYLIDKDNLKASNNIGSYSLISRKVIEAFKKYNDYQFHYLLVLKWLGFDSAYIEIEHNDRFEGKSSYSFKKLVEHSLVAITYQSDKLLRLNIYIGIVISVGAFIWGLIIIGIYFVQGFQAGWASTFVMILFSLGIILLSIGIVGLYLGKMFDQVKHRPRFVVDIERNLEEVNDAH